MKRAKVINAPIWQEYLDIVESVRKTDLGKKIYARRKETIERIFFGRKREAHHALYTPQKPARSHKMG